MKKYLFIIFTLLGLAAMGTSCTKSPAHTCVGKYEGTYMLDSLNAGTATTTVVEVNSLTVNLQVDFDNNTDISMIDVALIGGDEPYTMEYDGLEGILTGTASKTDMVWTLEADTNTFIFTGVK